VFPPLRYLLCSALLLFVASPNQVAQQAPSSPPPGKPQVRVFCVAVATDGSLESPSLMSATIDKQPVQITSLRSAKDDKLLFALLLDLSTSQASKSAQIKDAAWQLFERLAADGNQGYLVEFDTDVRMSKTPLRLSEVQWNLDRTAFGGGTSLYDAIWKTCKQVLSKSGNPQFPRRAIIVLSDGDDNQSRIKRKEAIETAEKEGVAIFSLVTSSPRSPGRQFLRDASRATGGLETTQKEIPDGVTTLLSAIDSQLAIGLDSPVAPDQKLHVFEITTSKKDVQLSATAHILAQ